MITNFVIHPDEGRRQKTEVDIMAVRFPYRSELLLNPMIDDRIFTSSGYHTKVILAEVKLGACNLNGPWTDPSRSNMERAIRAAGPFPSERIDEVARALYGRGVYTDERFAMTLFCAGKVINKELRRKYPDVPQVTFEDMLRFIYCRFKEYRNEKCDHSQWDKCGQWLFDIVSVSSSPDVFLERISVELDPKRPKSQCNRPSTPAVDE